MRNRLNLCESIGEKADDLWEQGLNGIIEPALSEFEIRPEQCTVVSLGFGNKPGDIIRVQQGIIDSPDSIKVSRRFSIVEAPFTVYGTAPPVSDRTYVNNYNGESRFVIDTVCTEITPRTFKFEVKAGNLPFHFEGNSTSSRSNYYQLVLPWGLENFGDLDRWTKAYTGHLSVYKKLPDLGHHFFEILDLTRNLRSDIFSNGRSVNKIVVIDLDQCYEG